MMLCRLLLSIKTKFQKWTNKQIIVQCVKPLNRWIKTDKERRTQCFLALGAPLEGEELDDLGRECQVLVLESLLRYSKGLNNDSKVHPYGSKAATNTDAFNKIPSPWFAATLACMYPFVVNDESQYPQLLKQVQYPIPTLWPKPIVKRYIHFNNIVHRQREQMFKTYEDNGGDFHGPDEESEYEDTPEQKDSQDLDCDMVF